MRLRVLAAAVVVLCFGAVAGEPDPEVLSYKMPSDLKWVENAAYPGLKSAVLHGDPTKPGPYAVRNRFSAGVFSRPHFHPNDRVIVVISGTWWIGTGEKFDPEGTKPMPPGSVTVHYGGKVHYDGARFEDAEIIIYGIGPATTTRIGGQQ
jgi:hypothetical protein